MMPPLVPANTDSPVVRESLRITMPSQARAGVPINVTSVAVDAAGRPLSSFNGSATVVSSDPEARLPLVPVPFRNGRASFQVTLLALDAQGRPVTSHCGIATLTSTDAQARFPSTVTFVNGRATVRVIFGTLGPQTLSAGQGTPSAPPSGGAERRHRGQRHDPGRRRGHSADPPVMAIRDI